MYDLPLHSYSSRDSTGAGSDAVLLESILWGKLDKERVNLYRDPKTGSLNEFHLMFSLRKEFPLHFFVFRQTAVHVCSEANAEDTFSLSGSLSNENTHTGADFLACLTRINRNKRRYKPPAQVVLNKYIVKFRECPMLGDDVTEVDCHSSSANESDSENDEVNGGG